MIIEVIKALEGEIVRLVEDLRKSITVLQEERSMLLKEIAKLRKRAEGKITELESEIDKLRKEKEMLQELLGPPKKRKTKPGESSKLPVEPR